MWNSLVDKSLTVIKMLKALFLKKMIFERNLEKKL